MIYRLYFHMADDHIFRRKCSFYGQRENEGKVCMHYFAMGGRARLWGF